jgi:hypothetical protein
VIDAFLEMCHQRVIFAFVLVRLIAVVWLATVGAAQTQELFSARQGLGSPVLGVPNATWWTK